jgi:arsenate reductase-like glutaredoxin family protein
MVDDPILMERPIAVYGEKAVIARPLERINEIL